MEGKVFTAMQYVEPALEPGQRYTGPQETLLGEFEVEADAVTVARAAWVEFREGIAHEHDVAWWIVRANDEELARWIADSRSEFERVLDLTTNQLVEYRP
jgi:hypothetical protein